jgi:hypothetical protein
MLDLFHALARDLDLSQGSLPGFLDEGMQHHDPPPDSREGGIRESDGKRLSAAEPT